MTLQKTFAFVLAFLALGLRDPLSAWASEAGAVEPARVSALEGELLLQTPFEAQEQPVTLNAVLREGDSLRVGEAAKAELELPGGSFVRLAAGARMSIPRLSPSIELVLETGTAELSQGSGGVDAAMTTATDIRVGVAVSEGGRVRVDVDSGTDGRVRIRVVEGRVETTCADRTHTLSPGEPVTCEASGALAGAPREASEAFDAWAAAREKTVRTAQPPPAAVVGRYEGLHDLDGYGTWVEVDARWFWRPIVSAAWRPYFDGYFSWCDPFGWTWVPYQPWGFVTHHYGRWVWLRHHGWVWSPAPIFAGAWVSWAALDGYLGWAPCDFYGRPIVIVSTHSHYDHAVWIFGRPDYFWRGGGSWRSRLKTSPETWSRARSSVVAPSQEGAGASPFFQLDKDLLNHLRPRPIRDPRMILPEHVMHDRPNPELPMLPEGPSEREGVTARPGNELLELLRQDAARAFQPHEAARARPPLELSRDLGAPALSPGLTDDMGRSRSRISERPVPSAPGVRARARSDQDDPSKPWSVPTQNPRPPVPSPWKPPSPAFVIPRQTAPSAWRPPTPPAPSVPPPAQAARPATPSSPKRSTPLTSPVFPAPPKASPLPYPQNKPTRPSVPRLGVPMKPINKK